MNRAKLSRQKILRRLFEDGAAAAAAVPAPTGTQDATQNATTDTENQTTNGEPNTTKAPFTAEDVAKMTAGEVINYLYVNTPEGLDPQTKNALLDRADKLRQEAERNNNIKDKAKEIMRSVGLSLEL